MDREAEDLVHRLCTMAGAIMEDVSPAALIKPSDADLSIKQLDQAAADIATLARAAEVVLRRS